MYSLSSCSLIKDGQRIDTWKVYDTFNTKPKIWTHILHELSNISNTDQQFAIHSYESRNPGSSSYCSSKSLKC